MNEKKPPPLFSFIRRRSAPSPIALLPTNSISRIRTFGPSVMLKVTFTSFGPPSISLTSGLTSANW